MKHIWFSLLLVSSAALANPTPPIAPESRPDIVGEARDPDSGEIVYLEHYYCSADALKCSVFYLRPDRKLIASKELDYAPSKKAPVLTFKDYRSENEITIDQRDSGEVVDAGFDNFVRLQWQDLAEGAEVKFPFRMVGRDDPIGMRASREQRCEDDKLCLEIRLDSWLLGKLIDPIELTYDRDSQRLLRFQGISNLKNDRGRSQRVEIEYRYRESGEE